MQCRHFAGAWSPSKLIVLRAGKYYTAQSNQTVSRPIQRLGRTRRIVITTIKTEMSHPGRYEIKCRGEWVKTKSGVRIEDVILIYELFDGTTGKVGPEDWRLVRLRPSETVEWPRSNPFPIGC